uniref:SAP domain-containing protein n=1 Tax=Magallana gigas TaxID=29159 RepID=A0A8W8JR70_MAGGI
MENKKTPRKVKGFFELKHSQRGERKRKYQSAFQEASSCVHSDISSIKVQFNFDNGHVLSFFPRKVSPDENASLEDEGVKKSQDLAVIQQVIAVKDKFRISDEALHELHMIGSIIPSKSAINTEKYRLNTTLEIMSHPTADCSTRKLEHILEFVLQHQKYQKYIENDTVTLRFSCDGAKIAKNISSVRGVFKILAPRQSLPDKLEDLSMCPEDEFTLFFYIGDENRCSLEEYASGTLRDMENVQLNGIVINGRKISVKWIMTCDWKALALLRGINGAQCEFFCMWCHCSKKQICDFSIPSWLIQRSKEEQQTVLNSEKKTFGYKDTDLCPFISYHDMPIDDLHMRIRISLKLFNQLVTWAIDQKSEDNLKRELKRVGVSFRMWEERGDDKLNTKVRKWSQPTGDDLRKIIRDVQIHHILDNKKDRHYVSIESLSVQQLRDELTNRQLSKKGKKPELVARLKDAVGNNTKMRRNVGSRLQVSYDFSEDEEQDLDVAALQDLWSGFHMLMESLRALPGTDNYKDMETFAKEAKEWATEFRKQTFDEDVIPYIHGV